MKQRKDHKLVRDGIPAVIKANGGSPKIYTLSNEEFKVEARKKLVEEAEEVREAVSREDIIKELADLEEVKMAVIEAYEITPFEVEIARKARLREVGAFANKTYLNHVITSQ